VTVRENLRPQVTVGRDENATPSLDDLYPCCDENAVEILVILCYFGDSSYLSTPFT
jgi:hypothetical protein